MKTFTGIQPAHQKKAPHTGGSLMYLSPVWPSS